MPSRLCIEAQAHRLIGAYVGMLLSIRSRRLAFSCQVKLTTHKLTITLDKHWAS